MAASLRARLWLSYALLIVTALSVVAIVLFLFLLRNPFLYRQTLERLRAVESVVLTRDDLTQAGSLPAAMERAAETFDVRLVLFSQDRQMVLDTYPAGEPGLAFPGKRLLARSTPVVRDEDGGAWLYTLRQLPDRTWLMVATPRPRFSVLNVFTDELLPLIFQGGILALLLSLVVAFFFARWIADPLQKVILAARALPEAQTRPVEVSGPREVQDLTRAFNAMAARVRSSQQSQREFVANVSHELKTPLTSIQGFAQAILDGTAESAETQKQAAGVICQEAGRMHRLVLDLLDLARLDAGTADMTMAPLNLADLLQAVSQKFLPQVQKAGVTMQVEPAPDLPSISGDGDRLAQVFTNLVDNALKYTPNGGRIDLRLSVTGGEVLASVSDTGPGIPAEIQARIFDRFYQADPARRGGEKRGAGLGLAIAREIVQAHGGRISVRSRPGEGTTFDVFLPLSRVRAATWMHRRK
jgi:two-component system OmpR family sensor kinase